MRQRAPYTKTIAQKAKIRVDSRPLSVEFVPVESDRYLQIYQDLKRVAEICGYPEFRPKQINDISDIFALRDKTAIIGFLVVAVAG